MRYAKQDITEAIKFLTWLHSTHHRTAATCLQQDVDEWLASGPTTRSEDPKLVRLGEESPVEQIGARSLTSRAPPSRSLTQEQRLAWLKNYYRRLRTLAYRVAGILLLLYRPAPDQDRSAADNGGHLRDGEMRISLGKEPIPVPQPFADMLSRHMRNRPHLRTAGGVVDTPWLFPSIRPGRHLTRR